MTERIQNSRFERKYLVSEATARRIRDCAVRHLALDEHGAGCPDASYAVHSVYLDSDAMKTYWDTVQGVKNRFKLRLRFYEDTPDAPVFLEIKRRVNRRIVKQRAAVRREAAVSLLAGHVPSPSALVTDDPRQLVALEDFCRLARDLEAKPRMHVAYLREAYMPASGDDSMRLTLDRLVRCALDDRGQLSTALQDPLSLWGDAVVFELKFTSVLADWCVNLVRTFDLQSCSAAKYADSVTLMRGRAPELRSPPSPDLDWQWPGERNAIKSHRD